MSNKIYVEVMIPGIGKNDFMLPADMKMEQIKKLIAENVSLEYKGLDLTSGNLWLMDLDTQTILPDHLSTKEADLFNGSKLMLVAVNKEGVS